MYATIKQNVSRETFNMFHVKQLN